MELLSSVTVVSILASLLLPALGRARTSADAARCAANLRQFAIATQLYWHDSHGACFPFRQAPRGAGEIYWFGWLARGPEGSREFDPTPGALYPYLAFQRSLTVCPSLIASADYFKPKAGEAVCAYGYNRLLSPGSPETRATLPPGGDLSRLVIFADAGQVNTFQAPASPQRPLVEEFYFVDDHEQTAHFRHHGRAESAYADGHVGTELPEAGSVDARLVRERIGRIRVEGLRSATEGAVR